MDRRLNTAGRLAPDEARVLEQLYVDHAARLRTFFAKQTFAPQAARELVSDTFAAAAAGMANGARGDVRPERWLDALARHELARYLRRADRERWVQASAAANDYAPIAVRDELFQLVADAETKEQVADAISRLPEREKLVIALYSYEGLTAHVRVARSARS